MVQFGTGYLMPMDREYGHTEIAHGHDHRHEASPSNNSTNDVGIGIKDIGMSLAVGPVPNVPAIGAKLRGGMKTLEIGFIGAGKGTGQQQTPEYYGKKQREALVEIGKANEVNFTTHASFGVQGLAGMDQQGNFSKASKNFSLQEIKRAIEFAADVAKGGPIVVHTGEFQRPITGTEWNTEGEYANKFRMYEHEEERESYKVVDTRTGGTISEARKNRAVSRPVWKRYNDHDEYWKEKGGKDYYDEKGNLVKKDSYIDYEGNLVEPAKRVPVFDKEAGHFKVKQYNWGDLEKEATEMTQRAQEEFDRWGKMSEKEKNESIWRERINTAKTAGLGKADINIRAEEAYIIATLETNAAHARGWALQYGGDFDEEVKMLKKLKEAKNFYQKIEDETDPKEQWKLKKQARDRYGLGDLIPMETEMPTTIIDKQMKMLKHRLEQAREAASSQYVQAEEAMETIRHVRSAETYALDEAYDSYAEAGMFAKEQTEKMKRAGKYNKPLAVAMENLFPESYGAHPDEMIKLVDNSRKRMQEMLKRRDPRMSEREAKETSEKHITATLDTGHINIWRKYWVGDVKKTIEQNDKDFDDWVVNKVAEMTKKKVIGHIHLDDNYGYHDDHLAPGEGNTPITRMMKALKDNGYKGELVVEPGADWTTDTGGFQSVIKTWRLFGSPVYGAGTGATGSRGWGDVGYGWFGKNQPPYFTFGAYSPSEEWTLWSGVPLE